MRFRACPCSPCSNSAQPHNTGPLRLELCSLSSSAAPGSSPSFASASASAATQASLSQPRPAASAVPASACAAPECVGHGRLRGFHARYKGAGAIALGAAGDFVRRTACHSYAYDIAYHTARLQRQRRRHRRISAKLATASRLLPMAAGISRPISTFALARSDVAHVFVKLHIN